MFCTQTTSGIKNELSSISDKNFEDFNKAVDQFNEYRKNHEWEKLSGLIKLLSCDDVELDSDGFPKISNRWNPPKGSNPPPLFEQDKRVNQGRKFTERVSARPGCATSYFKQQYIRRLQTFSQKMPKKYSQLPEPLGEIIFSMKVSELLTFGLSFPDRNFCKKAIEESEILKFLCRITDKHLSPGFIQYDEERGCCQREMGVELLSPRKDANLSEAAQFEKFFRSFHLQVFLRK